MKDNLPTYKLVEKQDVDYYGFQITEGEYKDVVYYYGEVKIEEDTEADKDAIADLAGETQDKIQETQEDSSISTTAETPKEKEKNKKERL